MAPAKEYQKQADVLLHSIGDIVGADWLWGK